MSGLIFLVLRIILSVVLFIFVWVVMTTLWRDLRHQNGLLMLEQVPLLILQMKTPQPQSPRHFIISEIYLGRDPACQFELTDSTISARHARLSYHHSQWWVEDLHSTNGTFLNHDRVVIATVLTDGDELRCGQVTFVVGIAKKEPTTPHTSD